MMIREGSLDLNDQVWDQESDPVDFPPEQVALATPTTNTSDVVTTIKVALAAQCATCKGGFEQIVNDLRRRDDKLYWRCTLRCGATPAHSIVLVMDADWLKAGL